MKEKLQNIEKIKERIAQQPATIDEHKELINRIERLRHTHDLMKTKANQSHELAANSQRELAETQREVCSKYI